MQTRLQAIIEKDMMIGEMVKVSQEAGNILKKKIAYKSIIVLLLREAGEEICTSGEKTDHHILEPGEIDGRLGIQKINKNRRAKFPPRHCEAVKSPRGG